jgi:hypothetical protein
MFGVSQFWSEELYVLREFYLMQVAVADECPEQRQTSERFQIFTS